MRLVVVPRDTDAELRDQGIREKAIVVQARAVGVLQAVALKVALRGPACGTEYGRLENGWTLEAESGAQAIFIGEVGIYFGIDEIRVFVERQESKIIVGGLRVNWGRQKANELCRNGVDQGRRDYVWATRCIGAGRTERVHRSPIRAWHRSRAGG